MNRPAFFDTNIFVYADDRSAPSKHEIVIALIADHRRRLGHLTPSAARILCSRHA